MRSSRFSARTIIDAKKIYLDTLHPKHLRLYQVLPNQYNRTPLRRRCQGIQRYFSSSYPFHPFIQRHSRAQQQSHQVKVYNTYSFMLKSTYTSKTKQMRFIQSINQSINQNTFAKTSKLISPSPLPAPFRIRKALHCLILPAFLISGKILDCPSWRSLLQFNLLFGFG
jgi:hypothetical protein